NTNLNFLLGPKIELDAEPPPVFVVVAPVLEPLPPPHASSAMAAIPAAPPVSAARRVTARKRECGVSSCLESDHSSRSMASSTVSRSDISILSSFDAEGGGDVSDHNCDMSTSPPEMAAGGDNKPQRRRRAAVMADVARVAGVSHQTVARVINDSINVRPATR